MSEQSTARIETTKLAMRAGLEVELLNYGATLKSIRVPVGGELIDVVLSYAGNEAYLEDKVYMGATVGRYAGRIDSGRAELNGGPIQLEQNEPTTGHCLHGGPTGFSHRLWSIGHHNEQSVSYEYVSEDGDQGFPGCLTARVGYRMSGPMSLQIDFFAETDQDTFINLSNHAYFNLNRVNSRIDDHSLLINSDLYTPLGKNSLPTGEIRRVDGSVFDFRQKTRLGDRLDTPVRQLQLAGGFDHFFLLKNDTQRHEVAASLYSPESGIRMKLYTDQPGVQFYSGNWLSSPFEPGAGLCLEFQDIPNAPNLKGFPSTVLRRGETYRRQITLEFECD
jgi:aldose 1-epimerase